MFHCDEDNSNIVNLLTANSTTFGQTSFIFKTPLLLLRLPSSTTCVWEFGSTNYCAYFCHAFVLFVQYNMPE